MESREATLESAGGHYRAEMREGEKVAMLLIGTLEEMLKLTQVRRALGQGEGQL